MLMAIWAVNRQSKTSGGFRVFSENNTEKPAALPTAPAGRDL